VFLPLNQWCTSPLRLQASDCSTFVTMCDITTTTTTITIIIIIIIITALQSFVGPWAAFSVYWSYTQLVGLRRRGISQLQGRYQHKTTHRINAHNTDINALSAIRTQNPSVRVSENSSWLRPRGHCDQLYYIKRSKMASGCRDESH
jgi:hypothetical protein